MMIIIVIIKAIPIIIKTIIMSLNMITTLL